MRTARQTGQVLGRSAWVWASHETGMGFHGESLWLAARQFQRSLSCFLGFGQENRAEPNEEDADEDGFLEKS